MKLTDALRDLVHTIAPIDFDCIEVTRVNGVISFKAYTPDKTLIMRAETKEDIPEIDSDKFGLSNLGILQGLMNLKTYNSDDTSITYEKDKSRLFFKNDSANTSFILQKEKFVPAQPRFEEQPWDVTIDPSAAALSELKSFSSVFKSFSSVVTPSVENGDLLFFTGEKNKNTHSGKMVFAKTDQTLRQGYGYSIDRLMQTTARINNAKTKSLSISDTGMMGITIDTGLIVYKFFITGE